MTLPWILGAAALLVLVRLGWWAWDAFRARGTIHNPLPGGAAAQVPTTWALRRARDGTRGVAPWLDIRWEPAPAPWPAVVPDGGIVRLQAPLDWEAGMVQLIRVRVLARAPRATVEREWIDYLGELVVEDGAQEIPYRVSFSDAMILGVEEDL